MTVKEAEQKLEDACNLIFEVESQLKEGDYTRQLGYQTRIKLAVFHDAIRSRFRLTGRETVLS